MNPPKFRSPEFPIETVRRYMVFSPRTLPLVLWFHCAIATPIVWLVLLFAGRRMSLRTTWSIAKHSGAMLTIDIDRERERLDRLAHPEKWRLVER